MASILVLYGFRWHSDKPYRTRLRLVRYGLSECHLNPATRSIWLVRVPSKPISHSNGCHMHISKRRDHYLEISATRRKFVILHDLINISECDIL